MSDYYDWQLIKEMPLAQLDGLLLYAIKKETRKVTMPLWLAHFAISKLSGKEPIPYEEFIGEVETPKSNRTKDEIMTDFERIIQADRETRGN